MKTKNVSKYHRGAAIAVACLAVGWLCVGTVASGQSVPANLSPGLQEVVKLSQAHMSDDIITTYIRNSAVSYSLSADDILYLNSQGVSQGVIAVLQQRGASAPAVSTPSPAPSMTTVPAVTPAMPAPTPSTADVYVPPVAPVGSDINMPYFQSQLAPFGTWMDLPPYGLVWRPTDAQVIPGWRPYFNQGYWQFTDSGWFWHSDTPYGDIVFHYGRWLRDYRYGWVWVPGYDWAPAWVSWRHADGYAGWAPLPPFARYEVGVGLFYHGGLAVDVDFGLGPDDYVFVGYDHFWDHDYRPFLIGRDRVGFVFRASLVMNAHSIVDGRLVFDGLGRDRVALYSHHPVVVEKVVIRDSHIEHAREVERARVVAHVEEIRRRPANDPVRQNMERSEAIHRAPEPAHDPRMDRGGRSSVPPGRGDPKDSRDSRDSRDSKDSHQDR